MAPTAIERLQTLELYLQHRNTQIVADILQVGRPAIRMRLKRLKLKIPRPQNNASRSHFEDVNGPIKVAQIHLRLQLAAKREREKPTILIVGRKSISPEEWLQTFELYLKHRNTRRVAEVLQVKETAVWYRFARLGLKLPGRHKDTSLEQLNGKEKVAQVHFRLRENAILQPHRPRRIYNPSQQLQLIELFEQLQDATKVATALGVDKNSVTSRLRTLGLKPRPPGKWSSRPTFEQVNSADRILAFKEALRKAMTSE